MTLVYERAEYDELKTRAGRRVDDECQANFAIAEGYGKVAGFGPISRYWRSRQSDPCP